MFVIPNRFSGQESGLALRKEQIPRYASE